jgi:hypothetical protein
LVLLEFSFKKKDGARGYTHITRKIDCAPSVYHHIFLLYLNLLIFIAPSSQPLQHRASSQKSI